MSTAEKPPAFVHRVLSQRAVLWTAIAALAVPAGIAVAGVAWFDGRAEKPAKAVEVRVERLERQQGELVQWMVAKESRDGERYDSLQRTLRTAQPDPRAAELARPVPVPMLDGGAP